MDTLLRLVRKSNDTRSGTRNLVSNPTLSVRLRMEIRPDSTGGPQAGESWASCQVVLVLSAVGWMAQPHSRRQPCGLGAAGAQPPPAGAWGATRAGLKACPLCVQVPPPQPRADRGPARAPWETSSFSEFFLLLFRFKESARHLGVFSLDVNHRAAPCRHRGPCKPSHARHPRGLFGANTG